MSFLDDVADLIADEVSHIGLAAGPNAGDEFSGDGYGHQVPEYGSASGAIANITNGPLEFSGPPNTEVTHLIYKRGGSFWVSRPVDTPRFFNSDGRINLNSARVGPTVFTD